MTERFPPQDAVQRAIRRGIASRWTPERIASELGISVKVVTDFIDENMRKTEL